MNTITSLPINVNKLLRAALEYARLGWAVFPCHSIGKGGRCTCGDTDCKSPGKHPRTPHGRNDATTNRKTIKAWWEKWPDANVAIATGIESGLAVLDCDDGRGGIAALDELRKEQPAAFATPLYTRTGGGGAHLFFRHRPGLKNGTDLLAEGVDVRAEGGYVIAPPSLHASGRRYKWKCDFDAVKGQELPPFPQLEIQPRRRASTRANADGELPMIAEGSRNDALTSEAGVQRSLGKNEHEITEHLRRINAARCRPPLDDAEVQSIAASVAKYPVHTPPGSAKKEGPLTDSGNAELLADTFGDELRYNHQRQTWLVWRKHFWEPDRDGELNRMALRAARRRQRDAAEILNPNARKAAFNWGVASESRNRIEACTALARNIPPLSDAGDKWDQDPLLLGCQNGVVNLQTGELQAGRREDRITMATPHDYKPDTKCRRWRRFLRDILPDDEVRKFVSLAVGYSITGCAKEQCFFLLNGIGSNGKTTLLETLANVLGPITINMPFSTFTAKWGGHGQSNDLARLPGKRLVSASETGETSTLDEARIKALSGEDTITARLLYQEYFAFRPCCKLWLSCNHRPNCARRHLCFLAARPLH